MEILTNLVLSLVILLGAWYGGSWLRDLVQKQPKLDQTLRSFLGGLVKYTIFAIAFVTVLTQFGVETTSLIAVLGAAGLAIGLALQGTLSNVAAGVMLLVLRPFNVGDFIEYNGVSGTVKSLSLFGTELSTLDNVYVYAPNSSIWNTNIYNFSRNLQRRHDLSIGVSYDDNIDKAIKVVQDVIEADERILSADNYAPYIAVESLAASSVNLKVRIWTEGDHLRIKLDVLKAIKEALDANGITIPYPTQTITFAAADSDNPIAKKAPAKKASPKKAVKKTAKKDAE